MNFTWLHFTWMLARGGGGGSSGGGGGGGIIELPLIIIAAILAFWWRHHRMKQAHQKLEAAEQTDPSWDPDSLKHRVAEVFTQFENDWSRLDVEAMTPYVTKSYRQRMVLELSVLRQMQRRNQMDNLALNSIAFYGADDEPGSDQDQFTVEIKASARDALISTVDNRTLYLDNSPFKEYWTFSREAQIWKLHDISQFLPARSSEEQQFEDLIGLSQAPNVQVQAFAQQHNFFYDADFGRLILPNTGVLFRKAKFASSDINDHVIGLYRDVIIQFYRYLPIRGNSRNSTAYTIAQAVLPKSYGDIVLKRREWIQFGPRGLRSASLEDPQFNKAFRVWASNLDAIPALELLTPNFMEKLLTLKFQVNLEVVDSTLYLYTTSTKADFDQMLEVLEWAFREMKM